MWHLWYRYVHGDLVLEYEYRGDRRVVLVPQIEVDWLVSEMKRGGSLAAWDRVEWLRRYG